MPVHLYIPPADTELPRLGDPAQVARFISGLAWLVDEGELVLLFVDPDERLRYAILVVGARAEDLVGELDSLVAHCRWGATGLWIGETSPTPGRHPPRQLGLVPEGVGLLGWVVVGPDGYRWTQPVTP